MISVNKNLLIRNSPILVVELITILLLSYIAYGEANRKYEQFQLAKMASQAEIVQNSIDPQLQAGIPIAQVGGFTPLSDALIRSDQDIQQIRIVDNAGDVVFLNAPPQSGQDDHYSPMGEGVDEASARYQESVQRYRVILPLSGKFGSVGRIEFDVSKQAVSRPINAHFSTIFYSSILLLMVFSLFVLTYTVLSEKNEHLNRYKKQVFNIAYLVSFIVISTLIAISVFKVYEEGAGAKIDALANTMSHRAKAVLELGIELEDIDGLNRAFQKYIQYNPEIDSIAITRDGVNLFHNDPAEIDRVYHAPADSYEYLKVLQSKGEAPISLVVTIPIDIVRDAILSRAKEFLVLMLACGLMSWVFLDAGSGLVQRAGQNRRSTSSSVEVEGFKVGLKLIKPAYFLIVFTSALPVSFLPQLVTEMAGNSSSAIASTTLPFTIYYFIFAAVLIPAGRYAEQGELKRMMAVGFVAELVGLLLIALSSEYWLLTLGRASSGFAQGVFLIGLNSYTLSITPREKRTQGAAVKVNGRNAALVSGTSIGALLYAYIDYQSVFTIAATISLVGILYLWQLVPSVREIIDASAVANIRRATRISSLKSDLLAVVRDAEFLKTLIFIGLIGKMAITGVIMFSIPLILSDKGFAAEDIGQAIMLYYLASIVITRFASRQVDASGASRVILIASAMIGGIGMVLIGITGIEQWDYSNLFPGFSALITLALGFNHWLAQFDMVGIHNYIILLGIVLAGISNGMMAAPIMTHIDKTKVAQQYGNKAVAATYLFLERGGHVVGPMVVSFLLLFAQQTTIGIAIFGSVTLMMSVVFMLTSRQA